MATIVLIHPFPVDATFWDPVAGVLRAAGHDVLTPNLPGFGGRQLEPDWTMRGEADSLAAQIPAGSVVVGLSMGGYAALALLAAHPDRVGSLVLADTRAAGEAPEGMAGRRDTAASLRANGSAAFLDAFVPKALRPDPAPAVVAQVRQIAEAQPADAMADATMAIATRDDTDGLLPDIAVPVLVIVGEHDAIIPPSVHTEMAARIPDATLAVIGGAGHLTALEEPQEFSDLLLAHIARS